MKSNKTSLERFVIVVRDSRAKEIRAKYASSSLAQFVMKRQGESYDSYATEESILEEVVREIRDAVSELGPTLVVERKYLVGTPLLPTDVIICVGQDGLVANTLRYAQSIPIFGVNPNPKAYEGVLLKFDAQSLLTYLSKPQQASYQEVTLAQCSLSTGAMLLAANDLFIGKSDHTSALYRIEYSKSKEHHSSSGIIVSTPMGSSGWQRSVIAGAMSLIKGITGLKKEIKMKPISMDSPYLRFWVREPWPSLRSQSGLVTGKIKAESPLQIISEMGEGGVIFADGVVGDSYPFPAGTRAVITPAPLKGRLVLP